jgi:hypothetical protein
VGDTSFDSQATVPAAQDAPASEKKSTGTRDSLSVEVCEPPETPNTFQGKEVYTWSDLIDCGNVFVVDEEEPWTTFVLNANVHDESSAALHDVHWGFDGKLKALENFDARLAANNLYPGEGVLIFGLTALFNQRCVDSQPCAVRICGDVNHEQLVL